VHIILFRCVKVLFSLKLHTFYHFCLLCASSVVKDQQRLIRRLSYFFIDKFACHRVAKLLITTEFVKILLFDVTWPGVH